MDNFQGLIAATHTPFSPTGELALAVIEKQAEHLLANRIEKVFIAGTTGESHSLSVSERQALATRWSEVANGTKMQIIVHVGANSISDVRALASHAGGLKVSAISAIGPSYFRPKSPRVLVQWCQEIVHAAPGLPFYYYHIPSLTGIDVSLTEFIDIALHEMPNFYGIKFSHHDLMLYQLCQDRSAGKLEMPWGTDEYLLAGIACGATSAVGSTYNFMAKRFHRILQALTQHDWQLARQEQRDAAKAVSLLASQGFMESVKYMLTRMGIPVGAARLPHGTLTDEQKRHIDSWLEWITE